MNGYMHRGYAESLAEFGTPHRLPLCDGWILRRRIAEFPDCDAMGCYPLFACRDWSQLHQDLADLKQIVSLSLVPDPFGDYDLAYLQKCFDLVTPFKEHFLADFEQPLAAIVSKHHRYYALKAFEKVRVERCETPSQFVDDWTQLYMNLIERHHLRGIKGFSRAAFAQQLEVPGIVVFRAVHEHQTVGAHLWYVQGEVGYSHLAACSSIGYDLMASYALYWSAMEFFTGKVRWLNLGAGAGTGSSGGDTDGLSRFKKGWANETRNAYFCGRIFDKARYEEITKLKNGRAAGYFPAYRKGEFE